MTRHETCPHCGGSLKFSIGRPKRIVNFNIVKLRAKGLSYAKIANKLKIGIATVHYHIKQWDRETDPNIND